MDGPAAVCYHRPTEGMAVIRWMKVGIVTMGAMVSAATALPAAEQEYVIWRSSALGGFDWQPSSRAYPSKQDCDEAVEGRKRRIERVVAFLQRIGVDDTLQRAVGDRIYECRPTLTGPSPGPSRGGGSQSP